MSIICAPFYVMVSEIPIYRSHIVDLSFARSAHCCHKCNLTGFNNCPSEIHVGHCTPAAHIGVFAGSVSPNSILPDLSVSSRLYPTNLPLPLPTPSCKSSRTVHHYKFGSSAQSPESPSGSTVSTATATIIPKRKINSGIIQDKSSVNGDVETTDLPIVDSRSSSKSTKIAQVPKPANRSDIRCSDIPKFYFPRGKPKSNEEIISLVKSINEKLQSLESRSSPNSPLAIHKSKMNEVTKILKVPLYWKHLIFTNSGGNENNLNIFRENLVSMWQKISANNYSDGSKLFSLLTQDKKSYIEPPDFYPLVQDVLETHPGLTFLLSARDFHSRYIATVVYRIYFGINSSWSGKITLQELEKSDLLSVLESLETTDDINTITQYFSYEHFYVIYCKFWELDEDHDLVISKADLARHNNYAISERMIERIFSGAVTKSRARTEGLMTYTEFVWFLLAEEDKQHPRSIEYWFRCMDLDGDGILSLYELDYFYQEQLFRMEEMGIEPISFEDCICQMMDMIKPKEENKIRLSDLKNCRLVSIFLDTFFNLTKYLEHEQRDPFTNLKDLEEGLNEMTDWDRYASEAYEILVAEDGSQDNYNDNFRESNQVYRNNAGTRDDEVVYENVGSKQNVQGKKAEKIYESSRYNDFVNDKLCDMADNSSSLPFSIGNN